MLENRWAMLAVIFLTRTAMGLMYQSLAAVGPFLIEDLHLTYFHYSLLLGLFLLPGGVMALPGGMLGQRFGSRHIASAGLGLMAVGGFVTAESPGLCARRGRSRRHRDRRRTAERCAHQDGRRLVHGTGDLHGDGGHAHQLPGRYGPRDGLSASGRRLVHMARRHPRHRGRDRGGPASARVLVQEPAGARGDLRAARRLRGPVDET